MGAKCLVIALHICAGHNLVRLDIANVSSEKKKKTPDLKEFKCLLERCSVVRTLGALAQDTNKFNSQHPCQVGESQLPVTPDTGGLMPSWNTCGSGTCTQTHK